MEPRHMAVSPDEVDIRDVELECGTCGATVTLPAGLAQWWAEAHWQPRMTGAIVALVGDVSGTLWHWRRPD